MLTHATFLKTLQMQTWYKPGLRILCACSGGPDSTALLHLLHSTTDMEVGVVHFNHQLRGRKSDGDETFVLELADHLGLNFFVLSENVKQYASDNKLSLEEAGSQLRRAQILRVANTHKFDLIATGQHENDQVETILMNLLNGCGMEGLTGIASHHPPYVRPLLSFKKQELLDYLSENRFNYRTDDSNLDSRFLRNRIRHEVLPALQAITGESLHGTFIAIAKSSNTIINSIRHSAEHIVNKEIMSPSTTKISLGLRSLSDYFSPIKKMIFDSAFQSISHADQGLSSRHFQHLLILLDDQSISRTVQLPLGIIATRDRTALTMVNVARTTWSGAELMHGGSFRQSFFSINRQLAAPSVHIRDPHYFWPPNKLSEYEVRPVRSGDALLIGSGEKMVPILQILQEAHIAPHIKSFFPVLVYREQVVWVPGVRTAASAMLETSVVQMDEKRHCIKAQFNEGIFE